MARISIPEQHVRGFTEISKLTKEEVQGLTEYLNQLAISIDINKTLDGVNEHLSSKVKIKNSEVIVQTIVSFIDLIKPNEEEQLVKDLADAYVELNLGSVGKHKIESLKENLNTIIRSCKRLILVFKAYELAYGNDKVFNEGKFISDLRILFEEDTEKSNRHAIILHKFLIKYASSGRRVDAFFTMDLADLHNLKTAVELAIQNDAIIKEEYKNNLNFI